MKYCKTTQSIFQCRKKKIVKITLYCWAWRLYWGIGGGGGGARGGGGGGGGGGRGRGLGTHRAPNALWRLGAAVELKINVSYF